MPEVILRQPWVESEAGWGQRPDGATLHLSMADRDNYIHQHWEREKRENPGVDVPAVYSYPAGEPVQVKATEEQISKLVTLQTKGQFGMWE